MDKQEAIHQLVSAAKGISQGTGYSSTGRPEDGVIHLLEDARQAMKGLKPYPEWLKSCFLRDIILEPSGLNDGLLALMRNHLHFLACQLPIHQSMIKESEHPALSRHLKTIDRTYMAYKSETISLSYEETMAMMDGYRSLITWAMDAATSHPLGISKGYQVNRAPRLLPQLEASQNLLASRKLSERLEGFLGSGGNLFCLIAHHESPLPEWRAMVNSGDLHALCIQSATFEKKRESLKSIEKIFGIPEAKDPLDH